MFKKAEEHSFMLVSIIAVAAIAGLVFTVTRAGITGAAVTGSAVSAAVTNTWTSMVMLVGIGAILGVALLSMYKK